MTLGRLPWPGDRASLANDELRRVELLTVGGIEPAPHIPEIQTGQGLGYTGPDVAAKLLVAVGNSGQGRSPARLYPPVPVRVSFELLENLDRSPGCGWRLGPGT